MIPVWGSSRIPRPGSWLSEVPLQDMELWEPFLSIYLVLGTLCTLCITSLGLSILYSHQGAGM